MIILDTHISIWNVQGDKRLSKEHLNLIREHEKDEIGISAISL